MNIDKEKISSEFLIEEYKHSWAYYKVILENRKNLLDWYFKIVTIPATLFTIIVALDNKVKIAEILQNNLGLIFLTIFLSGVGLYIAYARESGNAWSYLAAINKVKKFVFPPPNHVILYYDLDCTERKCLREVSFWRAFPLVTINSFLFGVSVYYGITQLRLIGAFWYVAFAFLMSFASHIYYYPKLFMKAIRTFDEEQIADKVNEKVDKSEEPSILVNPPV